MNPICGGLVAIRHLLGICSGEVLLMSRFNINHRVSVIFKKNVIIVASCHMENMSKQRLLLFVKCIHNFFKKMTNLTAFFKRCISYTF